MPRIFNLLIEHEGKSYPALLTISGDNRESSIVRVISNEQRIEIVLPNGSLTFSSAEVLKQLRENNEENGQSYMKITPHITLQLLHSDW